VLLEEIQIIEIGLTGVLPHMTSTNILRSDGSGSVRKYCMCYQIKVSCCFAFVGRVPVLHYILILRASCQKGISVKSLIYRRLNSEAYLV
jgi:hypothetical protein